MTARAVDTEPIYYGPYVRLRDRHEPASGVAADAEEQPLYWNDAYGFWALSRFETCGTPTTTPRPSARRMGSSWSSSTPRPVQDDDLMDPPEHDILRKIISRAFTPGGWPARGSIGALAARYLDPFVGTAGFDYVADFGALLPPMIIGEMLGVPEAERNEIRLLTDDMMHIERVPPAERRGDRGRAKPTSTTPR